MVDYDQTYKTHQSQLQGSPEECGCDDCQNFVKRREEIYPSEIKELFYNLGVDYKKESEIMWNGDIAPNLHSYSGFFHFKGRFKGKNCVIPTSNTSAWFDLTRLTDRFSIGFHYDNSETFFKKEFLD